MYKSPDQFSSLFELLEYFNNEQICLAYLAEQRWQGEVECHFCKHTNVYELKGKTKRYKCAACRQQFNAKAGTIFEDSKIPLRKWYAAIYLILSHRKGISSYQLARDLKLTQKTAWFMGHRIRYAIKQGTFDKALDGIVEMDETFVGGKNKNRHADKKVKQCQGRSFKDKTPVFGMVQRQGELRAFVIPDTKAESIQPIVQDQVEYGSTIYSDEWHAYRGLNRYYDHAIVNHAARQYVDGEIHTNTIEGFWGQFKRSIIGIYHQVSPKHLQRYVDEAVYRYNNKALTDGHKALNLLQKSTGSLKYKALVYVKKES
ncbi:IS1595 family transposase [Ferruginibacter sp.]